MKNNKFLKKLASLLIIITVLCGFVINPVAQIGNFSRSNETPKGYVTLSIEKFTLGLGYVNEPIKVPFYNGENVAKIVTDILGEGNYKNTGSIDSGFYLSYLKDDDTREPNVPQYILDECGDIDSRSEENWLGEFDYTFMSGWMYCVNNSFPNYGMADYEPEDGDVIRLQFTVYGYGMDIGGGYSEDSSGGSFGGSYVKIANKDALTKAVAEINSDDNKEEILSKASVKSAYNEAYRVLEIVDSSQEDVDAALKNLQDALKESGSGSSGEIVVTPSTSVETAINETAAYMCNNVTEPTFGTLAGEWTILSLARAGYNVPEGYYDGYYDKVLAKLNECNGVLSTSKYTEYSRLILALTAIGKDVTNVGGYNLLDYLSDFNNVKKQGINGPIFALIALDTKNYEIPINPSAKVQNTRDTMIDYILEKEIKTGTEEAGGWALSGTTPDPDITAMALQALSKYKDNEKVKPYIDRALDKLSGIQNEDGGYSSWGSVNSESIAQVITALTSLGIDPAKDSRFIKNGNWTISALMNFYVEGGGFKHILSADRDAMATDQGMYAIVAYDRFVNKKTSLYNMTDVEDSQKEDIIGKVILDLPEKISGNVGSEFNINVRVGSYPEGDYKLLDGVIDIPEGIEIKSVKANSNNITGGLCDFGVQDNKLRLVYSNTSLENINCVSNEFPAELLTITAKITKEFSEEQKLDFNVESFELKQSSDESKTYSYGVTSASTVVGKSVKASARVLYSGDGIDLISGDKKVVAVEFINLENTPNIIFNNTTMSYSEEFTTKKGVKTYVALVDLTIPLDDFNDINNYLIDDSLTPSTVSFGDVNNDETINAQDALNTLSAWLRKSDAPEGLDIVRMNVTGDSRINTYDALGIMEYYVNGSEYKVLSK